LVVTEAVPRFVSEGWLLPQPPFQASTVGTRTASAISAIEINAAGAMLRFKWPFIAGTLSSCRDLRELPDPDQLDLDKIAFDDPFSDTDFVWDGNTTRRDDLGGESLLSAQRLAWNIERI
jgi:hypothetical protein